MGLRKIRLLDPGASRKMDYAAWYLAHKKKINERRRAKRRTQRDKINKKQRDWYHTHKDRLKQFTPEGKFERKLKRNGYGPENIRRIPERV